MATSMWTEACVHAIESVGRRLCSCLLGGVPVASRYLTPRYGDQSERFSVRGCQKGKRIRGLHLTRHFASRVDYHRVA
jgi:hypothetical protein